MDLDKLLAQSLVMIDEVQNEIFNSTFIDCGLRLEVVFQCIEISIEHGIAVSSLLTADLPTPAMVVFRVQFESVVRAYWLLFIATNQEVMDINFNWTNEEQFLKDRFPMVSEMLEKLHAADLPAKGVINHFISFKKYHLKQLNSFVHTGRHSFIRNNVGFDPKMMGILMRQSNNLISSALQIMFKHSIPDKQIFLSNIHAKYPECFYMEDDVDPAMKARVDSYFQ